MYNVFGVNLPFQKKIYISLQYIYGIGKYRSEVVCYRNNIDKNIITKNLSNSEFIKIRRFIDLFYCIEGHLKTQIFVNIKRLLDIKCYKGLRHKKKLPVRGQRTHTNARTNKHLKFNS